MRSGLAVSVCTFRVSVWTYRSPLLLQRLASAARHVVDDGGKVGGSVEAEVGEAAGVGLGDALHPWGDQEQRAGGEEEEPAGLTKHVVPVVAVVLNIPYM